MAKMANPASLRHSIIWFLVTCHVIGTISGLPLGLVIASSLTSGRYDTVKQDEPVTKPKDPVATVEEQSLASAAEGPHQVTVEELKLKETGCQLSATCNLQPEPHPVLFETKRSGAVAVSSGNVSLALVAATESRKSSVLPLESHKIPVEHVPESKSEIHSVPQEKAAPIKSSPPFHQPDPSPKPHRPNAPKHHVEQHHGQYQVFDDINYSDSKMAGLREHLVSHQPWDLSHQPDYKHEYEYSHVPTSPCNQHVRDKPSNKNKKWLRFPSQEHAAHNFENHPVNFEHEELPRPKWEDTRGEVIETPRQPQRKEQPGNDYEHHDFMNNQQRNHNQASKAGQNQRSSKQDWEPRKGHPYYRTAEEVEQDRIREIAMRRYFAKRAPEL